MKYRLLYSVSAIVFFVSNSLFAQNISINTGHASVSMQLENMGTSAQLWITNTHHSDTYIISYTVEYTLGCKLNTITKTIKGREEVPAGRRFQGGTPQYFGECDNAKNIKFDISSARLTDLSVDVKAKANTTTANNTEKTSGNNTATNSTSSSSSSTETRYNTNPQIAEAVARQNRLNDLKAQQEQQQKAQQQANYEKAIAYEQQRQESIQRTNETVSAITGAVTDFLAQQREEKRLKEERRYNQMLAEDRRKAEEATIKAAFETKMNNRRAVITEFPAKDVPLASREKAPKIYYFIYACKNDLYTAEQSGVYVSNVFEIGMYNDGTRVYTSTIKNEIDSLTPLEETIHGYYYSLDEAEKMRNSFISLLRSNGVTINDITYKGKPGAKSATANSVATTPKTESKYGKTISLDAGKNDQNLAPAKINIAKPSELPRESPKKEDKESKYGKTIKID